MAKLRKLGNVLLDLEPLLDELVDGHELQMGDILALVRSHLLIHNPGCVEEFLDGSEPIYIYGHESQRSKKS